MGVADFPLEIFKAVKTKQAKDAAEKAKQPSPSSTTPASRSQTDLSVDDEKSIITEGSSRTSTSGPSTSKTSYENTDISTERTSRADTGTPMTSTTSFEAVHRTGSNSLKQALRGTLSRSRSQSRERKPGSRSQSRDRVFGRSSSPMRKSQTFDPSKLTIDNAIGAGKGVQRIVGAGMKSPMDFTLGIARGFHNAPKLYGDDTVRPQEKVTDFQSGLKAAGKVSLGIETILGDGEC
jgi:hypothetical protein